MGRRFFWIVCALGLGVRLVGLGAWGTFDVEVQKAWALRAASNLADIYGPSDREIAGEAAHTGGLWPLLTGEQRFPRTEFTWGTARYFVDYPPASLIVLAVEGKIYRALRPEAPNKPLLNALVNLGPLLASLAPCGSPVSERSVPEHGSVTRRFVLAQPRGDLRGAVSGLSRSDLLGVRRGVHPRLWRGNVSRSPLAWGWRRPSSNHRASCWRR